MKGVKSAETKVDTRITEMLKAGAVVSEQQTRRIFEDLMVASISSLPNSREPDVVRQTVREAVAASTSKEDTKARNSISGDIAFATYFYNNLFNLKLGRPGFKALSPSVRNAFWDGRSVSGPPQIQYIPDAIFHETAHLFIDHTADFDYRGQSGALSESFADVLATLALQNRLKQSAQTADWVLMRKGVAFIRGEDLATTTRLDPLRSLKDPGSAYNDPVLGKDPQIAHMRQFYTSSDDRGGGVRVNAGIPNKVFYEVAMKIGTEEAGQIWVQALKMLDSQSKFIDAAVATQTAARQISGEVGEAAVRAAWRSVGIPL